MPTNNNSPYVMGGANNKMALQLGATELSRLRGLVRDLLEVIDLDDTGVTSDLEDDALIAAEILGMVMPKSTIESD